MAALRSHAMRFPGETTRYRAARNRLLEAERDLRRRVEKVAVLRRKLPLGGQIPEDYVFEEGATDLADTGSVHSVKLSDLFRDGLDALMVYSFMFGPDVKQACPMCTSFIDSLNGAAPHFEQRANLAVVAKSPIGRIRDFARERGWNHLRLLSSARNTYNRDYHGESPDGGQMPSLNVFVRRSGKIHHSYNTELVFLPGDRGQNQRHNDMAWPLWNLLDFTPEGRGADWFPKLSYKK
jgi:predicted dithiol-disulfide oxidoreductase (DUF899 family)